MTPTTDGARDITPEAALDGRESHLGGSLRFFVRAHVICPPSAPLVSATLAPRPPRQQGLLVVWQQAATGDTFTIALWRAQCRNHCEAKTIRQVLRVSTAHCGRAQKRGRYRALVSLLGFVPVCPPSGLACGANTLSNTPQRVARKSWQTLSATLERAKEGVRLLSEGEKG